MSEIKEMRVREGEWNEALCFQDEDHPLTEVAAQRCKNDDSDYWNIFFVSSQSAITIRSGISTQQAAETIARSIAPKILSAKNPKQAAWNWNF
jgi:hypothetical protein